MARICDSCKQLIVQKDDEYLEIQVRVLNATEGDSQDSKQQSYGDFCDDCIVSGDALATLLRMADWTLEPKRQAAEVTP